MPDVAESRFWDHQLEEGYPDCRLAYQNRIDNRIIRNGQAFDAVFCAMCGKPQGISPVTTAFMFFVCDPCARDNPPDPELFREVAMPEFRYLATLPLPWKVTKVG